MDPKTLNALVHDREADLYDNRFRIHFDRRIGARVRRDVHRMAPDLMPWRRALDVGCGTGYLAIGLAAMDRDADVHACDLSPNMLERCAANARKVGVDVSLTLCDAESLPYADASFDLVCARGALHHVPSPLDALREMRRVLAPGGTAIVLAEPTPSGERQVGAVVGVADRAVETARRVLRRPRDPEQHAWELASIAANLHTFDPGDVERLAIKAGFEDITVWTASWAWVLAMGLNYYAAGELGWLARNPLSAAFGTAGVNTAAAFDRLVADVVVPPRWRHTVQAVLR